MHGMHEVRSSILLVSTIVNKGLERVVRFFLVLFCMLICLFPMAREIP